MGWRAGLLIVGGVVAIVALGQANSGGSHSIGMSATGAAALCAEKHDAIADYLAKAQNLGFLHFSHGTFEVDETGWSALEHDQKISLAVTAFCSEHPTGSGTTILYGLHDGASKASVTDGNYFD